MKLDAFRDELEKRIRRRLAILEAKEGKPLTVWDDEWLARTVNLLAWASAKHNSLGARKMCFALYPPKPVWSPQDLNEASPADQRLKRLGGP